MPSDRSIVRQYLELAPPEATAAELLAALDETEPPAAAPHVVHAKGGGRQAQPVIDREAPTDGMIGAKVEPRTGWTHTGLTECPDCHRGLVSRGDRGMICARLGLEEPMSACHGGCTVACGLED